MISQNLDSVIFSAAGVSQEARDVVQNVLIKANENLVTVPGHILQAIDKFMKQQVTSRDVTPTYVRDLLKNKQHSPSVVSNFDRREKLLVLEYVVSDSNMGHLQGVPLLPLANGTFKDFAGIRHINLAVYVASKEIPRNLFPNMDEKFLDDTRCYTAHKSLQSVAQSSHNFASGPTQLVKLGKEMVRDLLTRLSLPRDWFTGASDCVAWYPGRKGHPPASWMSAIWFLLRNEFPYDISSFENIPLIDTGHDSCHVLMKLRRNSRVIRQTAPGSILPGPVVELLRKAGCIVLSEVPQYMQHSCLPQYVALPTPDGVLQVLSAVRCNNCIQLISSCTLEQKKALRDFLAGMNHSLTRDQIVLLQLLPVFDTMDSRSTIAVRDRHVAPRDLWLPPEITVTNAHQIITLSDNNSLRLLGLLGRTPSTQAWFLKQCVLPSVANHLYSHNKVSILMHWVLERLPIFSSEDDSFTTYLQGLQFVPVGQDSLAFPTAVFDPREPLLQELFSGETEKFPQGTFMEPQILNQLQLVGIRNVMSLQPSDVVSIARKLTNFDMQQAHKKAQALLKLLNCRCGLLNQKVFDFGNVKPLKSVLESVDWVPARRTSPKPYPSGMEWYGSSDKLFKPSDVARSDRANLVGSSMPVLEEEVKPSLSFAFGWGEEPPIRNVIQQLKIAVTLVPQRFLSAANFQLMLGEIYQQISSCATKSDIQVLRDPLFPAWVWHGNGFAAPSQVIVSSLYDINVEPHLFALPKSYSTEVNQFFQKCGARNIEQESDLLDVLTMIKDKHEEGSKTEGEVIHDLHLTVNLLNWIVRNGEALPEELRKKVFVPVGTFDKTLKLVPCRQATFGDAAWLRRGGSESRHIVLKYTMIHEKVSHTTAKLLGVPPISSRVTGAKPIGFHAAGPYESITNRLNKILKEYKEGVGVFKELVQNADDAGATEVKFLVDWRHHKTESLFSPSMKACQGPALVAWSNSLFTNDDFQNIQKLAGATKKDDLEKIGRFGLGFNSVYHFTDVPSFVSRNFAVFFDPCTTHLGAMIEAKSRPGIMIDFEENPDSLHAYPDQFKPYHGLFGCDVGGQNPSATDAGFYYNGTIFRFPFRTTKSEISHEIYSRQDMDIVMKSFQDAASNLLLFVQNVKKVTVLELSGDNADPGSPRVLFEVERKSVMELSHRKLNVGSTFLQACAASAETTTSAPQQSEVVSISYKSFDSNVGEETTWLSSSCLGEGTSREIANSEEGRCQGLMACAGIGAKLSVQRHYMGKKNYQATKCKGEAFCFLPLSIPTGLPVHLNGYFAVTSNRRGIWEETTTDRGNFRPIEVRWNESLMEDALARAYIHLLEDMVKLRKCGSLKDYKFSLFWPNPSKLASSSWTPLVRGVYQLIASSDLPLVQSGSEWLRIDECIYPDSKLQSMPHSLEILRLFGYKVVDLPTFARQGFDIAFRGEVIEQRTMTQEKFLRDVFFPNIDTISPELRDPVVCFVLDKCLMSDGIYSTDGASSYLELLRNTSNRYIPCSTDQRALAHPKELVSPIGACAKLFRKDDNRFPIGECYRTPQRLLMLRKLGMKVDNLNWEDVHERCQSVVALQQNSNQCAARERIRELVRYLKKQHRSLGTPPTCMLQQLSSLRMLPVKLQSPEDFSLQWKGSLFCDTPFLSASEMYEDKHSLLIGAFAPVIDESIGTGCGKMGAEVRKLLGLQFRRPSPKEVTAQLREAIAYQRSNATSVENIVFAVYGFLQDNLDCVEELIEDDLSDTSWILIDNNFVKPSQAAFRWKGNGAPYLYALPDSLSHSYKALFKAVGVKESFPKHEFIEALHRFKGDKGETVLTDAELSVAKCFLNELTDTDEDTLNKEEGKIPLPDERRVLQSAEVLAINDVPWLTRISIETKFVHHDISAKLAYDLGAKDIRTKQLGEVSRSLGTPFGQRENLTDRLRSILKAYPRDVGILKELVQNADDACATEIHFVYDPRQHKTERMLSKTWDELQGPALCIYNNSIFSEDDLEGIQRLGIGSKADDPTKTGQYGIGFNAVYHVTDCPSFISNGDTLCILDPQVRYAPNASKQDPGRLVPLSNDIRTDYCDSFRGYLEEFFDLTQATMFRLPLRDAKMASSSDISKKQITEDEIDRLMTLFRMEAKEMLLFLNYVSKISLSKIRDDKLVPIYTVSADLFEDDIQKRKDLSAHVKVASKENTSDVLPFDITYSMKIKGLWKETEENWLVHQCIGLEESDKDDIPNGKPFGLLPRVGLAAKISDISSAVRYSRIPEKQKTYRAFCFLPLPVSTGLPVHVNGHFYLDSGRRHLWHDENDKGFGSSWNHFLKSQVLPQAYTSLLQHGKRYVPGLQRDGTFATEHSLRVGLHWYNGLFPPVDSVESQWKELSLAFYQLVSKRSEKLLPLAQTLESPNQSLRHRCEWLSTSQGFFSNLSTDRDDIDLAKVVLRVGFPLFHSPHQLFKNFTISKAQAKQLSPDAVLAFLKTFNVAESRCTIGDLPCQLQDTTIAFPSDLLNLVAYCMKSLTFSKQMEGLPLLVTVDNNLQMFTKETPVFLSSFHDLLPSFPHLFIKDSLCTMLEPNRELILESNAGIKKFNLVSLESLLASVVPRSWRRRDTFVKWEPGKDGAPTLKWMKRLWKLICKMKRSSEEVLGPLQPWALLPTRCSQLAPIAMAKKVFDLSFSEAWSLQQYRVVELLLKLDCPEVDMDIVKDNSVLRPYIAFPHKQQDVIEVLEHQMKHQDFSGQLTAENETMALLEFLQGDVESCKRQKAVIKQLPFFKSIKDEFVSIDKVRSVYVIPYGIPLDESAVWMNANNCLFLAPCPKLEDLYKSLGVSVQTQVQCYLQFIFPQFSQLKSTTRLAHLEYIRDVILYRSSDTDEELMVTEIVNLPFLPDVLGNLHKSSHFYDPGNPVFKIMLDDDKFPQAPFREDKWLKFLRKVGMKKDVDQGHFLSFAKDVARDAAVGITKKLTKKSETLVRYLFAHPLLQDQAFLGLVSKIKFVAPEKASASLLLLHPQCSSTGAKEVAFGEFLGAVLSEHERVVWTSAMLLPLWVQRDASDKVLKDLGVRDLPSVEQVLEQTLILSKNFSLSTDRELHWSRRNDLGKVMGDIYAFFKNSSSCSDCPAIGSDCDAHCRKIGHKLNLVPCVLVDDGRVFVRGDQLAVEVSEEFPPHLYKVPLNYGPYQHLLRRLGAMSKPSPLQYAKVLQRLKDESKGEKLHADEARQAKHAVWGLFTTLQSLSKFHAEEKKVDETHEGRIDELKVLYLPSKEGKLLRSCDLVSIDVIRFKSRVSKLQCSFLVDLCRDCGVDIQVEENELLPQQLRTRSLKSMVAEKILPTCKEKLCPAGGEGKCQELNNICGVLKSPELVQGIIRILKHQWKTTQLDQQVKERIESLPSKIDVCCMEMLDTQLIVKETDEPVPESQRSVRCFVTGDTDEMLIHIRHGAKLTRFNSILCSVLNVLTGNHVNHENRDNLLTCLACESPSEISAALDDKDVTPDGEEAIKQQSLDTELGSEIPFEFHQLLLQFSDFFFRPGEIVGYEKEEVEDDDSDPTYIYARIVRRVETHSKTEKEKKERKRGKSKMKAKQESILLSRYLIDIGSEQIEVDVLDLYKFKRQEHEDEAEEGKSCEASASYRQTMEMVPYRGKGKRQSKSPKAPPKDDPKPRNLQEALKEVRKVFAEIRKLPKDKQKKAIRRLYLRWHPDKNPPDMQEIANEVSKFIQSEATKLESGEGSASEDHFYSNAGFNFDSFFRSWGYRASRQRSSYENFRQHNPGHRTRFRSSFPGGASNFGFSRYVLSSVK